MKLRHKMIAAMLLSFFVLSFLLFRAFSPPLADWRGRASLLMTDWPQFTEPVRLWLVQGEIDRQRLLDAEIERNATDLHTMYRIEFRLSRDMVSSFFEQPDYFHSLGATRFDVSHFMIANGLTDDPGSSAILDTSRRSLVVINSGRNAYWARMLMNPFSPIQYGRAQSGALTSNAP